MYHPNVEHFAAGYDLRDTAFSVWKQEHMHCYTRKPGLNIYFLHLS